MPKWLRDLLTGPDGETIHMGRVGAIPMFFSGLSLPWAQLMRGDQIDLVAVGVLYAGLAGAVWTLVSGAKNMDIMPGTPPPTTPAVSGKPLAEETT